jgi:hypothetical protein
MDDISRRAESKSIFSVQMSNIDFRWKKMGVATIARPFLISDTK